MCRKVFFRGGGNSGFFQGVTKRMFSGGTIMDLKRFFAGEANSD